MNQEKIGKFIAECRKEKGLTQMQLAEQLGVTNRAVSKWETAKSMPDVSVMLPLCEILGVSVNELLCGEKMSMQDFKENSEKSILQIMSEIQKKIKENKVLYAILIILAIVTFLNLSYDFGEKVGRLLFILSH